MAEFDLFDQDGQLLNLIRDRTRYARLGSLIQGVSHNMNGNLQILYMQMEMIRRMMTSGEGGAASPFHQKMDQCLSQMEKIKAMLEALNLGSVGEPEEDCRKVDLNDVMEGVLSLFHHHLFFKHHVEVKKNFSSRLPLLHGQPADFTEGLSLLVENAIEAMGEASRKELTLTTRKGPEHLEVAITDTGCGLPEAFRPRVFTPFFTTKNGGGHYGLGLFMAKKILGSYGASIDPHFRKGETLFSVKIPLHPPHSNPGLKP